MPGRRPKPTALRELEGNPGHRPLNRLEPKPTGIPVCPNYLDAEGKREWKRISRELIAVGLLTSVDRAILASYCEAWSRWSQATRELHELASAKGKSVLVIATKSGNAIQNPLIGIINVAADQMRKLAVELGLSPASRSRLQIEPQHKDADPFEAFMAEIGANEPLEDELTDEQTGGVYPESPDRRTIDVEMGPLGD